MLLMEILPFAQTAYGMSVLNQSVVNQLLTVCLFHFCRQFIFKPIPINILYWVVQKIRADVEGKFKCRKFKF